MPRRNMEGTEGVREKAADYRAMDAVTADARVIVGGSCRAAADALLALVSTAGYRVVGSADTEREIVDVAINVACDLALIDVSTWTAAEVLAICEEVKITVGVPLLIVCEHVDREVCKQGSMAGIDAVLVSPVPSGQLVAAIELALARSSGATSSSGTYALATTEALAKTSGVADLSAREHEVFVLLARGYRPHEVGRELFISAHTVRKHAKIIFRKLGVHSQIELMRRHFGRATAR